MPMPLLDSDGVVRNVGASGAGQYTPPAGLSEGPRGGEIWGRWNGASYDPPGQIGSSCFTSTFGRTPVSATVQPGERTAVFICAGQSLICNHGQSKYTPSQKVENLNIYDGNLYALIDPVLGPTGADGSFIGRLGDKLIGAGLIDRAIFVPVGVTGTSSGDWASNPTNATARPLLGWVHERLLLAVNRIQALGLMPYVRAVLFQQGQADAFFGASASAYGPNIRDMIRRTRAYGLPAGVPWLVAQDTMINGVTYPAYRAEQSDVVNVGNGILSGPDVDTITVGNRYDGTHLNDVGNDLCATLWLNAIIASGILQAPWDHDHDLDKNP